MYPEEAKNQTLSSQEIMPKHIDYAQTVSKEMINTFSAKEQNEILSFVKNSINSHYENKICDIESELKKYHSYRGDFNGDFLKEPKPNY